MHRTDAFFRELSIVSLLESFMGDLVYRIQLAKGIKPKRFQLLQGQFQRQKI
jgi:hypothetical protein